MNLLRHNSTISLLWTSFQECFNGTLSPMSNSGSEKLAFEKASKRGFETSKQLWWKKVGRQIHDVSEEKITNLKMMSILLFLDAILKAKLRLNEWKNEWIVKQLYFRIAHFWNSRQVKISMKSDILWRTVNKKCCIVLKEYFLSRINFLSLS